MRDYLCILDVEFKPVIMFYVTIEDCQDFYEVKFQTSDDCMVNFAIYKEKELIQISNDQERFMTCQALTSSLIEIMVDGTKTVN